MDNQEKTKKKFYKKWWFWVIVVIVLFAIGNSGDKKIEKVENNNQNPVSDQKANNQVAPQEVEYVIVSAVDLSKAYNDNKVAADAKYENKDIKVNGVISSIGKDITDTPYVSLKGPESSFFGIQCMFSKDDESKLVDLSKGQSITLTGKLSGEMIGNVILRDCSIVE